MLFVVGVATGLLVVSGTKYGSVEVRVADESVSRVFVDGIDLGSTPLRIDRLTSGQHLIIVTDQHGHSAREVIEIEPDATRSLLLTIAAHNNGSPR